MNTIKTYYDSDGNKWTEEYIYSSDSGAGGGGGGVSIIRDPHGNHWDSTASGGWRPWHSKKVSRHQKPNPTRQNPVRMAQDHQRECEQLLKAIGIAKAAITEMRVCLSPSKQEAVDRYMAMIRETLEAK